jgi:hypothetical protein
MLEMKGTERTMHGEVFQRAKEGRLLSKHFQNTRHS